MRTNVFPILAALCIASCVVVCIGAKVADVTMLYGGTAAFLAFNTAYLILYIRLQRRIAELMRLIYGDHRPRRT